LFYWEKLSKGEECTNENTHYQKAHVKNIIERRFFSAKNIRPGTSEGFDKARNIRILTLSDVGKARRIMPVIKDIPNAVTFLCNSKSMATRKEGEHS